MNNHDNHVPLFNHDGSWFADEHEEVFLTNAQDIGLPTHTPQALLQATARRTAWNSGFKHNHEKNIHPALDKVLDEVRKDIEELKSLYKAVLGQSKLNREQIEFMFTTDPIDDTVEISEDFDDEPEPDPDWAIALHGHKDQMKQMTGAEQTELMLKLYWEGKLPDPFRAYIVKCALQGKPLSEANPSSVPRIGAIFSRGGLMRVKDKNGYKAWTAAKNGVKEDSVQSTPWYKKILHRK